MDPLAEKYINSSSYVYCHNNPVRLIDPTGMGDEDTQKNSSSALGTWVNNLKNLFSINIDLSSTEKRAESLHKQEAKNQEIKNLTTAVETTNTVLQVVVPFSSAAEIMANAEMGNSEAALAAVPWLVFEIATAGKGNLVKKGISVIGPRNTYREVAKLIGANFLDVTNDGWTWAKNQKFLKGVVKRGDDVIFAGTFNPTKLDPNSILAREIKFLKENGYIWGEGFSKLIKVK